MPFDNQTKPNLDTISLNCLSCRVVGLLLLAQFPLLHLPCYFTAARNLTPAAEIELQSTGCRCFGAPSVSILTPMMVEEAMWDLSWMVLEEVSARGGLSQYPHHFRPFFVPVIQSRCLMLIAFQSVSDCIPLMMLVASAYHAHAHVLQMKCLQNCKVQVYACEVDSIVEVGMCKTQEIEVILLYRSLPKHNKEQKCACSSREALLQCHNHGLLQSCHVPDESNTTLILYPILLHLW